MTLTTIADCRHKALALALEFRLGKNTGAALEMVQMVELLITQYSKSDQTQLQQLGVILGQLLQCQERRDWLALADYLEYELQDLLLPYS